MNIDGHAIGVCSWSLRIPDLAELIRTIRQIGLEHVQLALAPLAGLDAPGRQESLRLLRDSGLTITAGMASFPGEDYSSIAAIRKSGGFAPDDQWSQRRPLAVACGKIAHDLGLKLLTTHIGFIPPSSHPAYRTMVQRICDVAEVFQPLGLDLLMETGQETASELLQFLNDVHCRNVGVNFDPGNMILYGAGDPIEAIRVLGRHIRHVHIKDAILSEQPGIKWGQEVPFGAGQVGAKRFLAVLKQVGYAGPLVIEREAGEDRIGDVRRAVEALKQAASM